MERDKLDFDKNILDEFGKLVVTDCYDPSYANLDSLRKKINPPLIFKEYTTLFRSLEEQEFIVLKRYLRENIQGVIHDFLRIFEENQQFKLIYDNGNKQLNLNEISEMLKAEPIIEGGWIERFSKEIK